MKKYTVLVIEDERPLRAALKTEFLEHQFRVLEAADGNEGLVIAKKEHPDLILLDLIMPTKDGMTMLRELRQDAWGKDVHVILLTNVSGPEKVTEAAELGAYDYFVKTDIDLSEIATRIEERLSAHQSGTSADKQRKN